MGRKEAKEIHHAICSTFKLRSTIHSGARACLLRLERVMPDTARNRSLACMEYPTAAAAGIKGATVLALMAVRAEREKLLLFTFLMSSATLLPAQRCGCVEC